MKINKKLVLVGGIILLLLIAGCATTAKAQPINTNFQVMWSEKYEDASTNGWGYRIFTKIDIPQDNRECYVTRYVESIAMVCYDKGVK